MFSNGVSRPDAPGPSAPKPADQVKHTDKSAQEAGQQTGKPSAPVDRANISADAAEVARYRELAELHREAYGPEDRSEKLAEVKRRLESGYYESDEVSDKLAGRLVDESVARPAGSSELDAVRNRTESGFYDRPEVVDKTAENMIRSILPNRER